MDWNDIGDRFGVLGERVGKGLKRMFGSENERIVRAMEPLIAGINGLEPWAQGLDQDGMRAKMAELKEAVAKEETTLDDCMPEVFAMVREASVRTLGLRHFDVQMVGGYVLHQGKIAEMMTGEGKTLVATLSLSLNALAGRKCYLVTVNDYLAKRDANWMRPIFEYLGLSVGSIQSDMDPWLRKDIYACDIVYSTNNELGFDYLRDNMKTRREEQVQTDLFYAIVDEVDSVLVDEARTPLIISGPAEEHVGKYQQADQVVRQLTRDEHYEVKEKEKSASLTEEGIIKAEGILGIESFYQPGFEDWPHYIENAIRAHEIYKNDKEYVVEEVENERTGTKGMEVIIVDDFTGRKMHGRRWSDGLHQAVEVKEGLEPKKETQTLATITFQNYFRMFEKLSGMTGTALTEAGEFHKIYKLDVVSVPTNLPLARDDQQDTVYRTEPEKWTAIVEEIESLQERGQPVLVGTASVDNSEKLGKLLKQASIPHQVLNAKNNEAEKTEREAVIVARAGERGAVTVATNMAGRGTDIKLGGNFEWRLAEALDEAGLVEGDVERLAEIDAIRDRVKAQCEKDEQEVLELGGLYVLGTERHEARRIDNQLRGRSGRQGNAGVSRFFLSLQDPLMRIFYRDWVTNAMEKLGMSEGQAIESKMVSRAIAKAQRKVEDRNFEIRKSLLEYDEVMNTQRKTIYGVRQEVLEGKGLAERVIHMMRNVVESQALVYLDDADGYREWFHKNFGFELEPALATKATEKEDKDRDASAVQALVEQRYLARREELGDELAKRVEQYILLNAIDGKWKDHLYAVDALKTGIGLRGYGQQDPKTIYKAEGTQLFHEKLLPAIESEVASLVLRIEVRKPGDDEGQVAAGQGQGASPSGGLAPKGMVSGGARTEGAGQPSPAQVAAMRRQANQAVARRVMRQQVPASSAFDLVKRNRAAQPAPPKDSAPAVDYSGVGRNDSCPCGSGKKFKKCHGAS
jgi:preprotein translocase subunit SecA